MDSLREYTSATMPVGTSNTNADNSSVVPTRINWAGVSPATVASYREAATKIMEKQAEALNSINKYTNLAFNFNLENIFTFVVLRRRLVRGVSQLYTAGQAFNLTVMRMLSFGGLKTRPAMELRQIRRERVPQERALRSAKCYS